MMENFIIFLIAASVALSVWLLFWLSSRLVSAVPEQDRTWSDPPPLGFKIVWWPIQWLAHYLAPFITQKRYDARLAQLRQAGLDYAINPSQFLSGRIVWGLLFSAIIYWIAASFKFYSLLLILGGFILGYYYPAIWLTDLIKLRRIQMLKALPFYLDIITLCVESGLNINGALQQAVAKGPKGVLQAEFQRVLRDVRAGSSRSDALRSMAQRLNHTAVTNFTSTLIQAEATGMSLGPILRAQSEQRRNERFTRAEKIAMEAPVKLLFPLIVFIFPCVFIILLFPIAMKIMAQGF
ncbi:type II secretion system F family protein [Methylotenera sp. N17]|uniref:type II secretion system F family protein n=1 Tax=Methylotenera sp. N17 TaxID=1502761 RepID=UPI0006477CAD|nr:type II secretion system F family protein [Methylotenera sp. N17]